MCVCVRDVKHIFILYCDRGSIGELGVVVGLLSSGLVGGDLFSH